jgi:O-antigen/teichoic acid export membrane protein
VGYYEVLFQLGYAPMLLATGIVVQLYAPIFFERSGASRDPARNAQVHRSITRVTMLVCAATAIAALAGWALCDAIFRLAAGEQYRSVAYLLPWMIAAGGIFGAGQTVSLHFMTELKPARMLGAKITTALLGVAANCAGAHAFGVPGVVAASLAFSIAYFGWIAIAARRSLRQLR